MTQQYSAKFFIALQAMKVAENNRGFKNVFVDISVFLGRGECWGVNEKWTEISDLGCLYINHWKEKMIFFLNFILEGKQGKIPWSPANFTNIILFYFNKIYSDVLLVFFPLSLVLCILPLYLENISSLVSWAKRI